MRRPLATLLVLALCSGCATVERRLHEVQAL